MLNELVARAGTVVSKQTLLDACWPDTFVTEASLLEAIRLLRQALGDDRLNPTYIRTVHRRGYRFLADVRTSPDAVDAHARDVRDSLRSDNPWRALVAAGGSALIATVAVAMAFALFGHRAPEPRPTVRFSIALPDGMAIDPLRGSVAVSADGRRMVYAASAEGLPRLFLRSIDSEALVSVSGSDGAADPFFSPDGEWIGFFAQGRLNKLPVAGGKPIVLCAARAGGGAVWAGDGTIVFGGGPGGGLARVSAEGGEPAVIAAPRAGSRELMFGWPDLSPDGRHIVFTAMSLADSTVALLDLASGRWQTLLESAAFARYSPTGHLVFERRGRLEAMPFSFDAGQRQAAPPRAVFRDLATAGAASAGPQYAFSRTGSLVYVPAAAGFDDDERLHWLHTGGVLEPISSPAAGVGSVDVTPNLRRMALAVQGEAGHDVWIGDLERGGWSRLPAVGQSISPTWRPDGLEIAFAYSKTGPFNVFVRPADPASHPQPLIDSPWNQLPTSWSADGRSLAFTEHHPLTGADVWVLDLGTRERRAAVRTLFDESHARFSPDGKWLVYMSNERGRWDVFLRRADGTGARVQLSAAGGAWPSWSVDGRTIYFSSGGRTAAVAIQFAPTLRAADPVMISSRDDLQLASGRADLDRVLVRRTSGARPRHEVRVVLEWFSELTRLVRLPA